MDVIEIGEEMMELAETAERLKLRLVIDFQAPRVSLVDPERGPVYTEQAETWYFCIRGINWQALVHEDVQDD